MYQPRFYRLWSREKDLVSFNVTLKETDLLVSACRNLSRKTYKLVRKYRAGIEKYIKNNPAFLTTFKPYKIKDTAPEIVKRMVTETEKAGVGPMASVAGAIAEFVGFDLLKSSDEIIIENGGDIFVKTLKPRIIGIYAGKSKFSGKIGLEIKPESTPLGICTSSGTVGHSLSFGKTDATIVIANSSSLADACATAVGNIVRDPESLVKGTDFAKSIKGIKGMIIIINNKISIWGDIKLVEI